MLPRDGTGLMPGWPLGTNDKGFSFLICLVTALTVRSGPAFSFGLSDQASTSSRGFRRAG